MTKCPQREKGGERAVETATSEVLRQERARLAAGPEGRPCQGAHTEDSGCSREHQGCYWRGLNRREKQGRRWRVQDSMDEITSRFALSKLSLGLALWASR